MKITGYGLREAIKQQELRASLLKQSFTGSLKVFPGEVKPTPQTVAADIQAAELAVAKLQTAQMAYNLNVRLSLEDPELGTVSLTLAEAIKSIGGLARVEKLWHSASGKKEERYGYNRVSDDEIDPSKIRSEATITPAEVMKAISVSARRAGVYRSAIAAANATVIDITDLDPALLG